MTFESTLTERQLIIQFLETLRELPDVDADLDHQELMGGSAHRYDAQIDLRVAGKPFILFIEAKKAVYPRDVRQVLWHLMEAKHNNLEARSEQRLSFLVAESISPGAKELLRDERVGYFDSGGSLYFPAPGAYFYIDKPPPKTFAKAVRAIFSGRRAQVLHAMLIRHKDWFGVKELAELAVVSPATASQVLSELDRFDWLVSRGQGPSKERHLREPAALLDAWAKQLVSSRPLNLRRYYVPATKNEELVGRVAKVFDAYNAEYAISYEAAAQRYAPFISSVSQVRARVAISSRIETAIADLGARVVSEGANLAIIEAKTPGELLFRERVGDAWLASPVQVYLDLLRGEGRSKDMAEHLRKEKIGF